LHAKYVHTYLKKAKDITIDEIAVYVKDAKNRGESVFMVDVMSMDVKSVDAPKEELFADDDLQHMVLPNISDSRRNSMNSPAPREAWDRIGFGMISSRAVLDNYNRPYTPVAAPRAPIIAQTNLPVDIEPFVETKPIIKQKTPVDKKPTWQLSMQPQKLLLNRPKTSGNRINKHNNYI
jgi:hypothetical protein